VSSREEKRKSTLWVPAVLVPNNTVVPRRNNLHRHCKGALSTPYPERNALHVELFTILSKHLPPHPSIYQRVPFCIYLKAKWKGSYWMWLYFFWTNLNNSFPTTQLYNLEYEIWSSHKSWRQAPQARLLPAQTTQLPAVTLLIFSSN